MLEQPSPRRMALTRRLRTASRGLLSPWGRCLLLVAVLAAAAGSVLAADPERLVTSGWPQQLTGIGAGLAFAVVYTVCTLAFVPKPLLNAAAGLLFGTRFGLPLAVIGTTAGAAAAFALGRGLGRDALRTLLRHRALTAVDGQLSNHGFRSVLLMRLIPGVPFAVANYAAAISRMRLSAFVTATALGVVPNTAAYVVAGSHAASPDSPVFLISMGTIGAMGLGSAATVWRVKRRSRTPAGNGAAPATASAGTASAASAGTASAETCPKSGDETRAKAGASV
jgi:uncharacterized membrane protein YdjX (TVP38/TMEM64 family)